MGTAVAALFTGRDVNTAINAAGNAAENNFVPVLVAGAVIAMQIATAIDVATNCYEFKVAMDKGDVDGAIAAGVAVGMAAVPGQKLIPAPLRKAVHGVVTKSVTRILHSKYGQAAAKAGGELVDAASSKVQNLANKAANSKAGQAFSNSSFGKGLQNAGDRLVQHVEGTTAQQAEKGTLHQAENAGKNIDLRVKPDGQGITLRLEFKEGMDPKAFDRKINNLTTAAEEGTLFGKIPHGVSESERKAVTRGYRSDLEDRIDSFYANNPIARNNARTKLDNSDIDHIIDLQFKGGNNRANLKALDAFTNQDLGRQASRQIPRGVEVFIEKIEVIKK